MKWDCKVNQEGDMTSTKNVDIKSSSDPQVKSFRKWTLQDWEDMRTERRGEWWPLHSDRKGRKRWPKAPPRGQGTEEEGPPSKRAWLVWSGRGSRGCQHFPTAPVCHAVVGPWAGVPGTAPGPGSSGTMLVRVLQLQTARTAAPGLVGGEVRAHTTGTCGGLCARSGQSSTRSHRGTQLRRGLPPRLTSLLTARYSKAWLIIQGTAGLFWLTQFHQTTQWKTDSEQIKKVSQVKIFIYDSEGTSKFPRATGSVTGPPTLLYRTDGEAVKRQGYLFDLMVSWTSYK